MENMIIGGGIALAFILGVVFGYSLGGNE